MKAIFKKKLSLDSKMKTVQRNISVFQQIKILFWKNVLIKWRMKMQSFQVRKKIKIKPK